MKAIISARLLASCDSSPGSKPYEIRDTRLQGFVLRVQPSGVRIFYAQHARGQRVTLGRVGVLTADEARERCEKVLGNVAHGRAPMHGIAAAERPSSGSGMTLRQFIEGTWEPWAKGNRKKTWYNTLSAVRCHYSDWFDLPLASITQQAVEDHLTKRLAAGDKASSVRRDCDALAGILTLALKRKLIEAHPVRACEKPKLDRNPKVRYLSIEEERRLRQALADRDRKMIEARDRANQHRGYKNRPKLPALPHFGDHLTVAVMLSMLTGMRLSELLRLRWSDITNVITLEETKGVDTRHQPILPEARQLLKKWKEQTNPAATDYVLPVRDNLKKAWKALLTRAKISKFRWNDLRHSYASAIMQEGGNLNTVRELLGHKELRTTLRYAHLGQSDKDAAAGLLTKRLTRISKSGKRAARRSTDRDQ